MSHEGPVEYMSRKQVPELVDWLVLRLGDARPEDPRAFMGALLTGSPPPTDAPGTVQVFLMRVSVNCHSVWLTCRLGGIDHELRDTDLMKGEQLTPEFLKMNPMGQVPTIRDADGTCLAQSSAILRYLCNKFPGARKLYPADLKLRAHCDEAIDWRNTLYQAIGDICYGPLGFGAHDEAKAEAAHKKLTDPDRGLWKVLTEHYIGKSLFICGDELSIADLAVFTTLTFLEVVDYELPSAVKAYKDRCWAEAGYEEVYNGAGGFGIKQYLDMKKGEGK